MGVCGFFFTWLKFTKGLLPAYFCTYGMGGESLGDRDSSDCTFPHSNVQENKLYDLYFYSLIRGLLESYLGSIRLNTNRHVLVL